LNCQFNPQFRRMFRAGRVRTRSQKAAIALDSPRKGLLSAYTVKPSVSVGQI